MIQLYLAIINVPYRESVHVVAKTKDLREQAIAEVLHRYGEKDTKGIVTRSFSTRKVVIVGDDY